MQVLFVLFLGFVIVNIIGSGDFATGLHRIWVVIGIALAVGLAIFLLLNGRKIAVLFATIVERIARLYYSLTPHPAKSMVETAMHTGAELDGKTFAEIMRPMPGGKIEKEVREEQARKLTEKAYRYAESMRAEADRIKAKAEQDAQFIKAQDDLLEAATVHEKAKARLKALRKRVR